MYEINTWTKQWKDCCLSDVIKLNCCLLSSGLLLKSHTVCYSTTGASMRNTTSSPWKSSMSRYNSPSLQVEHLFVYLFFIMIYWEDAFFFVSWCFCFKCFAFIHLRLFSRWDQNNSFTVHPRRSQRRPVARGRGALLQQGMILNKWTETPQMPFTYRCWIMVIFEFYFWLSCRVHIF